MDSKKQWIRFTPFSMHVWNDCLVYLKSLSRSAPDIKTAILDKLWQPLLQYALSCQKYIKRIELVNIFHYMLALDF
jgi:hypothetical protein